MGQPHFHPPVPLQHIPAALVQQGGFPWRNRLFPSPGRPCPVVDPRARLLAPSLPHCSLLITQGTSQRARHIRRCSLSDIIKISLKVFPLVLFLKVHNVTTEHRSPCSSSPQGKGGGKPRVPPEDCINKAFLLLVSFLLLSSSKLHHPVPLTLVIGGMSLRKNELPLAIGFT